MASNRNDLIVVGDSFVGKSSLISRMLKKSFDCTKVTATVGVAFRSLDFEYNSLKLKMAIWDTSGYKTNESLNTIYCHHSIAAIVVSI
jgi:Ras-related protein Rab-5C